MTVGWLVPKFVLGEGVKAKTKKSVVSLQIFIQKALSQKRKVGGGGGGG